VIGKQFIHVHSLKSEKW
jgi:hypothetical protein